MTGQHDCGSPARAAEGLRSPVRPLERRWQILAPTAERMLAACQKAWVFGGMGARNDMMFDGEEQHEYERFSELLFNATTFAILAAANSSLA